MFLTHTQTFHTWIIIGTRNEQYWSRLQVSQATKGEHVPVHTVKQTLLT